jgi:hypothetical protein
VRVSCPSCPMKKEPGRRERLAEPFRGSGMVNYTALSGRVKSKKGRPSKRPEPRRLRHPPGLARAADPPDIRPMPFVPVVVPHARGDDRRVHDDAGRPFPPPWKGGGIHPGPLRAAVPNARRGGDGAAVDPSRRRVERPLRFGQAGHRPLSPMRIEARPLIQLSVAFDGVAPLRPVPRRIANTPERSQGRSHRMSGTGARARRRVACRIPDTLAPAHVPSSRSRTPRSAAHPVRQRPSSPPGRSRPPLEHRLRHGRGCSSAVRGQPPAPSRTRSRPHARAA